MVANNVVCVGLFDTWTGRGSIFQQDPSVPMVCKRLTLPKNNNIWVIPRPAKLTAYSWCRWVLRWMSNTDKIPLVHNPDINTRKQTVLYRMQYMDMCYTINMTGANAMAWLFITREAHCCSSKIDWILVIYSTTRSGMNNSVNYMLTKYECSGLHYGWSLPG